MMKYPIPEKIPVQNREWLNRELTKAPIWCSVDLRDGNQALPMPMNPEKKLEYFQLLCAIGFKEIEVSFPSASQDDFDFVRNLIEKKLIPSDVRISVLTQAREPLIRRTVESLIGVDRAILHLYVATSDLHERIVFGKTHEETLNMAVEGTKLVRRFLKEYGLEGKIAYEFSPEEFTDSDIDFVLDLCIAVKEAWGKSTKRDFILNLPATVERRPPWHYADMIAYFIRNYPWMDETTISVHSHNDQGCAVAATEMTLLAGAERVEGTLFGHGERTGNVDLVTLALNLKSLGIDPKLDFSNLPKIAKAVEEASGIEVHQRHPYAGQLAFTAFSGSHQDAIRKGFERRKESQELFGVGTAAVILKLLEMPDGTTTAVVQGLRRFRLEDILYDDPFPVGKVEKLEERPVTMDDQEWHAIGESLKEMAGKIARHTNLGNEFNFALEHVGSLVFFVNFLASSGGMEYAEKQALLEMDDLKQRAIRLLELLGKQLKILELKEDIQKKVKTLLE